ncbi:MAG: RNA-binding transcriptional accessory protein, partial [Desulfobacteraceae bacterium]|nr:RNA-binding transcriptional accessory protein [Desulfobacteraceae bacterium]
MNERHTDSISQELKLQPKQVQTTAQLLEEGATIPFIARYRKEATGSLDEVQIGAIRDRLEQLESLDKRRSAVLKSLEDQGKLSPDLHEKILAAETLAVLEDIYLPFRPKRRTRAAIAREKGLEPLAALIFEQHRDADPAAEAERFVGVEEEVLSVEDALAGARDIIAEWVNENADARSVLRELFAVRAVLRTRVVQGKEEEGVQYRDYYDREEPIRTAPSHRILAARRGEKEGVLALHILPPEDDALATLDGLFVKNDSPAAQQVRSATHDSYKRLLAPSLETEMKQETKLRADREAIRVFSDNLRHLLMAPPLG